MITTPFDLPTGVARDQQDQARLRHARERSAGFSMGQYLQPPPMLFTRDGHNLFLGDMYRGAAAFLICGGPSRVAPVDALAATGVAMPQEVSLQEVIA